MQRVFLLLLLAAGLTACSSSTSPAGGTLPDASLAVIAGIANDFGSSNIAIAAASAPYSLTDDFSPDINSDMAVAAFGDYFYRIGRFGQDNLTRYAFSTPNSVDWQYSVNDPGESGANPYDILFVSDTKAYVLRYGETSIWVVDPSATTASTFKTGEIDLSGYDSDGDNVPQMAAGLILGSRLYVAMQNIDFAGFTFAPQQAWLTVIDTTTDTEIDTGRGTGGRLGVPLQLRNPVSLSALGNTLFVAATGSQAFGATPVDQFTGGVSAINLNDFSETVRLDDNAGTGQVNDMALLTDNIGYLITCAGFANCDLRPFNPGNGTLDAAVSGFDDLDLSSLAVSPLLELWVGIGDALAPGIRVLDPADNSVLATVATLKDPADIVFADPVNR